MSNLIPMPGTDIVPDGWADDYVWPWLQERTDTDGFTADAARLAGIEAAYKLIDADTLEIVKARRYLEVRWGELLGRGSDVRTAPGRNASHAGEPLDKDERARFRQLAAGGDTVIEAIRTAISADEMSRAELLRKASAIRQAEKPPIVRPEPAVGTYSTIVVDPPWPMAKIERDVRPNQVGFDYPTMNEDELKALHIPAADAAHLYLWTTHKFLPMALRLAEAWGFNYQCLMTWRKNVGFTPFSWMYSTEHVLFCTRGGLEVQRKGLRLDFEAKVREHSRKPDEFYELVRQASPGPRIDMFSRETREGFDVWGAEVGLLDA